MIPEEEELLPPDPESPDSEASEFNQVEGLSLRMTQAMNHYQWEEHHCFVCGVTDHFAREGFLCLAQGAFKLQRGGSAEEGTHPEKPSKEVTT